MLDGLSCHGTSGSPCGRTADLPVRGQFISLSEVSKPASGGFERVDPVVRAHRLHAGPAAPQTSPAIPGITSHSSGLLIHDDSSAR